MKKSLTAAALVGFLLTTPAFAGTKAGVTLPDTKTVAGQTLVLNGLGLREKLFIDIYVGGLYLPSKTTDGQKAIDVDAPKQIVMQFVYALTAEDLAKTMRESLAKAGSAEVRAKADTLAGWMEAVEPGDQIILEYVPGTGTSVIVKGKTKGTLAGTDMMKALFGIYLGPNPPTTDLKKGLLGS